MGKPERVAVIIFSLATIIMWLTILIPIFTTPMRRPQSLIRNHVLRLTPIGTSLDDVIAIIDSRDDLSGIIRVDLERGYSRLIFRHAPPFDYEWPVARTGEKSIILFLGNYRAWYISLIDFPSTNVHVLWGFDGDGALIAVDVVKSHGG